MKKVFYESEIEKPEFKFPLPGTLYVIIDSPVNIWISWEGFNVGLFKHSLYCTLNSNSI